MIEKKLYAGYVDPDVGGVPRSWHQVVQAPVIPRELVQGVPYPSTGPAPFQSWVVLESDSIALVNAKYQSGKRQGTMHVYGAWTGDNFTGRALWVRMLPDNAADSARTTVTGIRYACQDVRAGADVIRLLGR